MRGPPAGYSYPTSPNSYQQQQQQQTVHYRTSSSSSRHINPALTVNPTPISPRTYYSTVQPRSSSYSAQRNRGEIDDSPIIDPRAFQYLNNSERRQKKKNYDDIESGIDNRPIINLDALTQFERRRQQQLAKNNRLRGDDGGSKGGIDERSIVNADAFRYIENRNRDLRKQGQTDSSGIDDRPITNPDAFK